MKILIGITAQPWRLRTDVATAAMGAISRVYGISFGRDRFIGVIVASADPEVKSLRATLGGKTDE